MRNTTIPLLLISSLFSFSALAAQDIYVRGTFNQWSTTLMTYDDATQQYSVEVSLDDATDARFKFDVYGDWTENYGDNENDKIADLSGDDIVLAQGVGRYQISFDFSSKAYDVVFLDEDDNNQTQDWQRTVIFIYGQTQSGQDMFVRGGIDHNYANTQLGRNCQASNFGCAVPIRHLNLLNATTMGWKTNDNYLDWYGAEASQGGSGAQGTALDWTTNQWPADWGTRRTVEVDGYGEAALNTWGAHYWMLDVEMDCSKTVDGWFELKSYISNGPGWEGDVQQAGTPYQSGNHFARCGYVNTFQRGSSAVEMTPLKDEPKTECELDVWYMGDTDFDGLPDCAEQEGFVFDGMTFYEWGARQGVQDLFVEVDWMNAVDANDQGMIPQREALDKVVAAFAAQGIALHFDVGDLFDQQTGLNPDNYDLGGGNSVAHQTSISLTTVANSYKAQYMAAERQHYFYYMFFGSSQNTDGSSGSSGRAYIKGSTSLITLGKWWLNRNSSFATNRFINYQAGTVMHEFGHNLGLRHGGYEDKNRKPNYLSVMNYDYQLYGLPTIGMGEGDRFLMREFYSNDVCGDYTSSTLLNGPTQSYLNFVIDYSHGLSSILSENFIIEDSGFGHSGSAGIDFNCNGVAVDTIVNQDLNDDGLFNDLVDHNDWDNLYWYHAEQNAALAQGLAFDATISAEPMVPEIAEEETPSDAFFQQLWSE